ncbi:taste receptor type 2 member 1 [Pteronotus mesoamericanus]|uniref:taste receptor type 2 member 1 n=1 Tax=Pteronotus mesoamericanus TaxID=1884717 RepID=UPI0023EE0F9D|nr:taste receptor type 2 member 1 [Pteronotus parnellii mesoamericanus]
MLESLDITHLTFAAIQCFMGVLANGIIVVVNSTDLIKQRKMLPFDLLLCCLATCRICLQLVMFHLNLAILSLIEFPPPFWYFVTFMFIYKLELWLATWLSVFYCTKISTIAHPLFFWLKLRISKLVPWLILGTVLYALLTSVLHSNYAWILSQKTWSRIVFQNATTQTKDVPALQFAFLVIELSLPLVIFLISALLLIFSLGRHTQQMISTAAGARPPSASVHISALRSFLSFLVLYVSQYMMATLILSQIFKRRNFIFMFCMLVVGLYPSVHSIILILGNPKLKQNAKKFLLHSKCCQ